MYTFQGQDLIYSKLLFLDLSPIYLYGVQPDLTIFSMCGHLSFIWYTIRIKLLLGNPGIAVLWEKQTLTPGWGWLGEYIPRGDCTHITLS